MSFGERLGRAGYGTAMIGKMHLTPWQDTFGFDGRIIAEAKFHTDCPDDYQSFLLGHGWDRRRLYDTAGEEYLTYCTAVPSKVGADLHIDSFVGRSVCEYLRRVEGPFCLFASFLSPHNPFDPPAPYDTMFLDASFPPPQHGRGRGGAQAPRGLRVHQPPPEVALQHGQDPGRRAPSHERLLLRHVHAHRRLDRTDRGGR